MASVKELLLQQTAEAFSGRADMSIMGALKDITDAEGSWRVEAGVPTIEEIVRHVAWEFPCGAAFGRELKPGIVGAVELLDQAQGVLRGCLEAIPEAALDEAIPARHGKSGKFFLDHADARRVSRGDDSDAADAVEDREERRNRG